MASVKTKFIFVTGGVVSSLGKGLASASMGALLEARGLKVTILKMDPYINVDPGTMSPFQHGEVFVTDDGAETDLDLGHYERYVSTAMGRKNNCTTGQIYETVIAKSAAAISRRHVQVIPHITDEIKGAYWPQRKVTTSPSAKSAALWAISKACRLRRSGILPGTGGAENVLYVHLTLVPTSRRRRTQD